jgi:superfamily II DNA/RNA helicase
MTFEELGLSQKVLQAVQASGYTTPTPIQAQAIPPALQGRDILGIAQTGTGKTAAFTLPMLSRLESGRARARVPRTLILEPTRELAAQVEESFAKYGKNHRLNVALLIGGMAFGDQEAKIMRGADVLIATPGRLLDFFDRGKLLLTGIEILVIDEADRMLDMGFIPDIERVCKLVPFTRQTLFFSATMPPEITRLTEAFLHNPIRCEVSRAATTAITIRQALIASRGHADKRETLRNLIRGAENSRTRSSSATASATLRFCTARSSNTAFPPAPCTATWISWRAWPRSTRSRTATCRCSCVRTWRRAASTFPT